VNLNNLLSSGSSAFDEPFILAAQATQVYYVQNPIEKDWYVVVDSPPRDLFDMEAKIDECCFFNNTVVMPNLEGGIQIGLGMI
jgi:serine protease inhibitor